MAAVCLRGPTLDVAGGCSIEQEAAGWAEADRRLGAGARVDEVIRLQLGAVHVGLGG